MIISHKYRFIFIKTVKTAGTSIEIFLSQHCSEQDIITPIYPPVEPHAARNYKGFWNPIPELLRTNRRKPWTIIKQLIQRKKFYNHIPARNVMLRISGDVWKNYYKFCVDRNPWDKTLSHYHMLNHRSGGKMTLEEYFERGCFCKNFPLYTDRKGNLLVDKVIKYENLSEEFGEIMNMLGLPFNGSLGVKAKSEYRKDRQSYEKVFTSEQAKIIENEFKMEIIINGYNY
jgi:hypothetical protein